MSSSTDQPASMDCSQSHRQEKTNLLGLSREKMQAFCTSLGEKPFRAVQLLKWIHHNGVDDFNAMTNISKNLRARLHDCACIDAPEVVSQHDSADGTRKWAIRVSGGALVETVLIPDGERATLCVSSQVGCSLDCSFCSTGKQGFQRDLTAAEIIGQIWLAIKSYNGFAAGAERVVTNVVMMGMGEPLLNFDNVVDAMSLMLDDFGYGISKRRVTLSTSGVVPALDKLGDISEVSLAISLHAPNNALRDKLVPINKRYPIEQLLAACQRYWDKQQDTHRVTTVEYTLIAGVNDSVQQAHELAALLKDFPCKINLIPFNPFSQSAYRRPGTNAVKRFRQILSDANFITTIRSTRGDDINAACGQLVGQVADRTRRSERHKASYNQLQPLTIIP